MPPQLIPLDVEATINAILHQLLTADHPDVTVTPDRPFAENWSEPTLPIVRLTATGGAEPHAVVLHTPTIAGEVWAEDPSLASLLARETVAHINALSGTYEAPHGPALIYSASATLPRWLPDPLTQFPRYVFTGQLTARLAGA
ncbi:hypothetical protein GCM10027418_06640 [Mariniluteicoccus endophyticus]